MGIVGVIEDDYRPSDDEPFMNERQKEYFRRKLIAWRESILAESKETLAALQNESENHPDIADRASSETDRAIELRARDRQRKLIAKIEAALARIDDGSYGFCIETGDPISLRRLDARPIATLSVEAQERHERRETNLSRRISGASAAPPEQARHFRFQRFQIGERIVGLRLVRSPRLRRGGGAAGAASARAAPARSARRRDGRRGRLRAAAQRASCGHGCRRRRRSAAAAAAVGAGGAARARRRRRPAGATGRAGGGCGRCGGPPAADARARGAGVAGGGCRPVRRPAARRPVWRRGRLAAGSTRGGGGSGPGGRGRLDVASRRLADRRARRAAAAGARAHAGIDARRARRGSTRGGVALGRRAAATRGGWRLKPGFRASRRRRRE